MSDIKRWSTTAASNNSAPPDGAPENTMLLSQVNDWARETMAAVRRWYEGAEWIDLGHSLSQAGSTTFKALGSNYTTIYTTGRRLQIKDGGGTIYGDVLSSTFAGGDTSVVVTPDSGGIDSSLSSVAVGILQASNLSLPKDIYPSLRLSASALAAENATISYLVAHGGSLSSAFLANPTISGGTVSGLTINSASASTMSVAALMASFATISAMQVSSLSAATANISSLTASFVTILGGNASLNALSVSSIRAQGGSLSSMFMANPTISGGTLSGVTIASGSASALAVNSLSASFVTILGGNASLNALSVSSLKVGGTGVALQGRQTIWVPAAGMTPYSGDIAVATNLTFSTNAAMDVGVMAFPDTAGFPNCVFTVAMPKSWDLTSMAVQPYWTARSGSGTFILQSQCTAVSDNDSIDLSFSGAGASTDTFLNIDKMHVGPEASVSVANSPVSGDAVIFKIYRDPSDTLNGTVYLFGIKIYYATNAGNDA